MIIVFDAFGTLIEAKNRTNPYARLNKKSTSNLHRDFMTTNKPLQAFCEELGAQGMYESLKAALELEHQHMNLYEDVEPALRALRSRGATIGLCSNLAHGYGQRVRQLLPEMDAYILSYEVGHRKPEPLIYEKVCKALSCRPKDIIFVGDSLKADVQGPQSFGMRSFHLHRDAGVGLQDFLKSLGPKT